MPPTITGLPNIYDIMAGLIGLWTTGIITAFVIITIRDGWNQI